jgi:hypothetical protein
MWGYHKKATNIVMVIMLNWAEIMGEGLCQYLNQEKLNVLFKILNSMKDIWKQRN